MLVENTISEKTGRTAKTEKKKKKRAWKSSILTRVFTVRANEKEYVQLRKKADATGWSLSRLMIESTLYKSIRTHEQVVAENEQTEEMIFQMRRVGINLNQLNAALNTVRRGREASVTEIRMEAAVAEVESLIQELKKNL